MAELSKGQIEYVNMITKARMEKRDGNTEKAIGKLEELWEEIPETKYDYKESFLVVWALMEIAIEIKDVELMRKWLPHVFKADPGRHDIGDRELWAGQVEYECENFDKAYEYFAIANKKSMGRCFRKCEKKI